MNLGPMGDKAHAFSIYDPASFLPPTICSRLLLCGLAKKFFKAEMKQMMTQFIWKRKIHVTFASLHKYPRHILQPR